MMMHPARAATPASRIALVRVAASAVALGLAGVALLVAASRLAAAPSAHHALPEKSALPLDAITGALPANHPPLISQPSGWQPKCTRDATAVGSPQGDLLVERQALYDAFCNKYDWLKDGTGPQKACVEVGMAELEPGKRQCKVNVFGKDEPMLSGDEESADLHACFGPLGHLLGTWEGSAGKVYTAVPAYSPTAADEGTFLKEEIALIPGQPSATFHSIKNQTYREEITFEPVLGAVRNRGYEGANGISPGCQMDQFLYGVRYKLQVYQTSPTDEDGEEGGLLHEEVGMYMYNAVPASGGGSDWMVSRMGVVPHGVTMAAQGTFNSSSGSGAKEELLKSLRGANLDVTPVPQACFPADSYTTADQDWGPASAGVRDEDSTAENPTYLTMNPFLVSEAEQFESVLGSAHVVLKAEQLSQTPFIQAQAANSDFENHLWISKVQAADGSQKEVLQYAQRVMMKFQQRFDCLNCAGVTAESGDGCLTACAGMDKVYEGDQEKFQGQTFNEIAGEQHRQCYSCTPKESDACAKTDGLIMWPHMQVNTLTKTKDLYGKPVGAG